MNFDSSLLEKHIITNDINNVAVLIKFPKTSCEWHLPLSGPSNWSTFWFSCIVICHYLSWNCSCVWFIIIIIYLHVYWIVGVGGQSLPWRTEASVAEHVLGRVVQDMGWRGGAWSRQWGWLLLQGKNSKVLWIRWDTIKGIRKINVREKQAHFIKFKVWLLSNILREHFSHRCSLKETFCLVRTFRWCWVIFCQKVRWTDINYVWLVRKLCWLNGTVQDFLLEDWASCPLFTFWHSKCSTFGQGLF